MLLLNVVARCLRHELLPLGVVLSRPDAAHARHVTLGPNLAHRETRGLQRGAGVEEQSRDRTVRQRLGPQRGPSDVAIHPVIRGNTQGARAGPR